MARSRKAGTERKEEIVEAALRLIGQRGIASLTVATLANELNITGGALYRHFPSTDAILDAVVDKAIALIEGATPPEVASPTDWLRAFALTRSRAVGTHEGLFRLFTSEQFSLAIPPASARKLQAVVRKTSEQVTSKVAHGQKLGEFRADVSAQSLIPIVLGTVQFLAVKHSKTSPEVFETTLNSLFRLLAPNHPPKNGSSRI